MSFGSYTKNDVVLTYRSSLSFLILCSFPLFFVLPDLVGTLSGCVGSLPAGNFLLSGFVALADFTSFFLPAHCYQ